MKQIRPNIKLSALLLLVLSLHTLANSLEMPNLDFTSFQEQGICIAALTADDNDGQEQDGSCKPPKHSFIDYSTFLSPNYLILTYKPSVSRFMSHDLFQAPPKVYLEINVPPDNLA